MRIGQVSIFFAVCPPQTYSAENLQRSADFLKVDLTFLKLSRKIQKLSEDLKLHLQF